MNLVLAHGGDLSEPSGGHVRIVAFVGGLAERGAEVTVVAPEPDGDLPAGLHAATFVSVGVPVGGVIDQPLRALAVARRALCEAQARDARLHVVHSTMAGVVAALGGEGFLLDMHDLAFEGPLYGDLPLGGVVQRVVRRLEGRALRAAGNVVVVSDRMADRASEIWNVPRERFTVVPNGHDPETVAPYRDVPVVEDRVAFLGTLHPKLDADALVRLADAREVGEVIVVGDGERRGELARAASDREGLRVTGRLPDDEAFPLVAGSAVALNPQRASGLQASSSPVKLYYYAALGRPMVLSSGPEFAAQLAEEGAAVRVPAGDTNGFVERVVDLLRSPDRRRRMGERAVDCVATETWDGRAVQVARVYGLT